MKWLSISLVEKWLVSSVQFCVCSIRGRSSRPSGNGSAMKFRQSPVLIFRGGAVAARAGQTGANSGVEMVNSLDHHDDFPRERQSQNKAKVHQMP